jgi:hypothetical protein
MMATTIVDILKVSIRKEIGSACKSIIPSSDRYALHPRQMLQQCIPEAEQYPVIWSPVTGCQA